jgi:hypothetical protein
MAEIKSLDPVLAGHLAKEGIAAGEIELMRDYAPSPRGAGYSPYARTYRHAASGRHVAVVSALPGCDAYGQGCELEWRQKNGVIESGNNLFHSVVNGGKFEITALSEQPVGIKTNDSLVCFPQLFIGGVKVQVKTDVPRLLETDPVNENYHYNTLEWDYGVCLRRVRLIEGRLLGSWVFSNDPEADVTIRYNQSGAFRLKLGKFSVDTDTEVVPAAVFRNLTDYFPPDRNHYPFTVTDSQTFYPGSSAVDGEAYVNQKDESWASLKAEYGTGKTDTGTTSYALEFQSTSTSNQWSTLQRGIYLFDTSALGSDAVVTAAALSFYGQNKFDQIGNLGLSLQVYSSNPASNTSLAAGDFTTLGTSALSTAMPYADFSTSGYNDFALNSSGLAAISVTGVSKLGTREPTYDTGSSVPAWASSKYEGFIVYTSEQGTGYQPKLVVTYTTGTIIISSETGSGADGKSDYPAGAIVLSENAAAADSIAGPVASLNGAETGLGAEAISLTNPIPPYSVIMADTGKSSETIVASIRKPSKSSDTRVASEKGERQIPSRRTGIKSRRINL